MGQLLSKAMRQMASSARCTRSRSITVVVRLCVKVFLHNTFTHEAQGPAEAPWNRNGSDVDMHGKE